MNQNIVTVKTISSLVAVLLFTQLAGAQTNAPTNATTAATRTPTNSALSLPIPRGRVPLRGTNAARSSITNTVVPSVSGVASTNKVTAPSPLAPPTVAIPSLPSIPTKVVPAARTNANGEVANIQFNFQKMELEQILTQYSELVGRTLLRAPGLQPTMQITLKTQGDLTRSEAIVALETVLAMNGVTFVPIGEKFSKVVLEANAPQAGGKFSEKSGDELAIAGEYVTQIVQLKYAQAAEVQGALTPFAKSPASIIGVPTSNTLILRDYSENVRRMLEVIEKIDTIAPMTIKPEVIPIKYALASDIQQVLGSLTASGPGISVGRSTRGASTTANGYQPGAPGASPIQGQPNSSPGQSPLSSAGTTGRSNFQNNLNRIVSRIASGSGSSDFQILGEAKIIADDRTNSLLIFANDQDMVMIKTIIGQLDVVLAQVLIEAIIMEVSLGDDKKLGVSYLQQPQRSGNFIGAGGVNNGQPFLDPSKFVTAIGSNATSGSSVGIGDLPGGFSYFGKIGNDFDIALTAIATDSRVNVLSRPRIQTSHAVPATLFIGDTVPYITGSSYGDLNGVSRSQYQEKRVGITLDVLPLINPDGLVVMDIQQNIQQLGTTVEIDGNPVPTTTERTASAKVAVRDRETIILGGFISTTKNTSKSGVPYLKDIPGLGLLFRSSTDSHRRVELIVLLRPTVLPSPEAAALVAASERDKLSGVKQGEFEIREMERKRQEKIDAEMRKKLGIRERSL